MATVQELLIKVLGDGSQFRRDISEDQREVDKMIGKMDGIHDALATVHVEDAESIAKVEEMKLKLAELRDRTARVDVNSEEGQAELLRIKEEIAQLKNKTVEIHVEDTEAILTINRVRAALDSLEDKEVNVKTKTSSDTPNQGDSQGLGVLASGIMTALPLISPLAAIAAAAVGGLASSFTAAGAGAVGFGAVAIPNIKSITDATSNLQKAQDQYNQATDDKGRKAALEAQKQALAGLDQEQQNAVKSLQSFQGFWGDFTKSFQSPVLSMFTTGLQVLQSLLTNMKPTIEASANAFNNLLKMFQQSLDTPPVKAFFDYLAKDAGPSITTFGQIAGNVMQGFMSLMVAFGPLGQQMNGGLLQMSQSFAQWAASVGQSQGFKDFIAYVQENGPKLINIVENVVKAVMNILVALAPLGAQMLTVIESVTKWIAEFTKANPGLVQLAGNIMVGVGAFSLFSKATSGIISPISGVIGKFKDFTGALSDAGVFTRIGGWLASAGSAIMNFGRVIVTVLRTVGIAMMTNPMILIITLIVAAVAFAAYEIYKHWDQISVFLQQTWQKISSGAVTAWNGILNFFRQWGLVLLAVIAPVIGIPLLIMQHWGQITAFAQQIWNNVKTYLVNTWNQIVQSAVTTWRNFTTSLQQIWNSIVNWVKNAAQNFANAIVNAFSWMYSHNYYFQNLVDFIKNAWNTIVQTTQAVWNTVTQFLMNAWTTIINTGQAIWNNFINFMAMIGNWEINLFQTTWNMIWGFLVSVWNAISSTAQSVWNAVANFFTWLWNTVSSTAQSVWNGIWNFLVGLWNNVSSTAQSIFNQVASFLSNLWNQISSNVSNAWNGIVSAMTEKANNAVDNVKNIFGRIGDFFVGLWSQARDWGANLITMVADGITGAAGKVGDAVKGVAGQIAGFLGFHSPTELGPGSDADTWAPNFMNMFTDGIKKYTPMLQDVMNKAIAPPKLAVSTSVSRMVTGNPNGAHNPNGNSNSQQAPSYKHEGPLLHIENLQVRNDQDINKLQRMIYDSQQQVMRGMGRRT